MVAGFHFKGTIAVSVDLTLLEARLSLSREGDFDYDEGAVVRILSDCGVTEGFDLESVLEQIKNYQKSKDAQLTFVAARGELPVPPTGEIWQWEELLPLPEESKALSTQILKAAGPPEVFLVRVEKVKVEKKTVGKGGLFGPGQEEVQTVIENREVREKVLVDPNPLKVYWVEVGTKVATIVPPRPGQPGKDLKGKVLAAPQGKVPVFYSGALLERKKNEVVVVDSGYLRIGRNWADLVRHRHHRWEVTYSPDKTSAFLTFEPGDSLAMPVSAASILERLEADGFRFPQALTGEEIQGLIDSTLRTRLPLISEPLVPNRDGSFTIRFTPDRTKAFLDIDKPLGHGEPFSLKDLGTKLREAQLKGFSFDAVKGVVQDFLGGPETELRDFLLAEGSHPTRGKDLILVFSMNFLSPEDLKTLQTNLAASPKYLEAVPDRTKLPPEFVEQAGAVHADQEFARLDPPEGGVGTEGVDVSGQRIPAIPGNEPPMLLLSNVRKNGNKLEAVIDGLLETALLDGVHVFRVRPHVDAMAVVLRSDDNLVAWLTLVQGRGSGRRLDRSLVDAALESAQIRVPLDEAKVKEALETALNGGKVEKWPVAHGIPAGNDLAKRLSFTNPSRVDTSGKTRASVKAGDVAATYRPPEEGQIDGRDVLGNMIPSPDTEIHNLVVSPDFEVETDDQGLQIIRALKNGDLVFDGEGLSLMTQVAVASVGGKAGNVKFSGDVIVAGGVETGAYVMAGNLKVRGRVAGALLSSDHNIQVADGIHGEGKAVLRAKKHISVGFVERALVMAVGDVHIGKSALGCTFRVNGKIFQKIPGGGLMGGVTKVRLGLDVMNLGSPSGQSTAVSFGQDYLVEDQIQAETKETDKLREAIVQLDSLMRKLGGPSDKDRLNSARQKKVLLMKMLAKRNLKLIHLRDKFELHVPCEIVIRETLFPGVTIESHGRVYEPKSRRSAIRLVFNEQTGHIEEFPLD